MEATCENCRWFKSEQMVGFGGDIGNCFFCGPSGKDAVGEHPACEHWENKIVQYLCEGCRFNGITRYENGGRYQVCRYTTPPTLNLIETETPFNSGCRKWFPKG